MEEVAPNPPALVTLNDLCREAGVSPRTIETYQRVGLLPKALRLRHPGRDRGVLGFWPASSLTTVREIRRLQAEGLSFDEVAVRILASRSRATTPVRPEIERVIAGWKARMINVSALDDDQFSREAVRGYTEGADSCSLLTLLEALLWHNLKALGLEDAFAHRVLIDATRDGQLGWAVELYAARHCPILVYNAQVGAHVTTDALLPHELNPAFWATLSEAPSPVPGLPYLVIPLAPILNRVVQCYDAAYAAQRVFPSFVAAPALYELQEGAVQEVPYHLIPVDPDSPAGPTFTFSLRPDKARIVSLTGERPAPEPTVPRRGARRKKRAMQAEAAGKL